MNAKADASALSKVYDNGFRDLKWGDSSNTLGEEYVLIVKDTIETGQLFAMYYKKNEINELGGSCVETIIYAFYDDKFTTISIIYDKENWDKVNSGLIAEYGRPHASKANYSLWATDRIGMELIVDNMGKTCATIGRYTQEDLKSISSSLSDSPAP